MPTRTSSSSLSTKIFSILTCIAISAFGGYWAFVSAFDTSTESRRIVITGSSTVAPLILEIAQRFEAENPGFRIDVQTGGSSRGISDVQNGLADIGMASRELKANESVLVTRRVAVDGIGFIVHQDNPVSQLSSNQIRQIFLGEINNWSEVGGADQEIAVVNKASGRGTLEVFLKHFGLREENIQADVIVGENQQAILTIGGNRSAVGYVSIGAADAEIKLGAKLKLLALDNIPASIQTVTDGSFPVSRNLNLVTTPDSPPAINRFIDFATSTKVNDLVESQYFIPISN